MAILREHFPAGIIIVPGGSRPRIKTFGDQSFVRGLMLDVTGQDPTPVEEGDDDDDDGGTTIRGS